jgi:hypothetical protein
VFATFRNARQRRDAILAAAEHALDAQKFELLEAILVVVGSAEKERDHLAHGCYGVSTAIADGILWIESRHVGPWNVSMIFKAPNFTGTEHAELTKQIFVYRKADLEAVYGEIHLAWQAAFDFNAFIRAPPNPNPDGTGDVLYRQLCSSPRIATALAQIRSGKKSNP